MCACTLCTDASVNRRERVRRHSYSEVGPSGESWMAVDFAISGAILSLRSLTRRAILRRGRLLKSSWRSRQTHGVYIDFHPCGRHELLIEKLSLRPPHCLCSAPHTRRGFWVDTMAEGSLARPVMCVQSVLRNESNIQGVL